MTQNKQPEDEILVVGLCGSLRVGSHTRMALDVALQGARDVGARTRLIDLREYKLDFCAAKDELNNYHEDVYRLRRDVKRSHGVILGTPEYHGSFSGVLKNALDLMGFSEFEGKMVGFLGLSGGRMGALNALSSLRAIMRALHAWAVPQQVAIPQAFCRSLRHSRSDSLYQQRWPYSQRF